MNTPPVAEIRPRTSAAHKLFGGSRLWFLTLLCLLIAAGLLWWSTPQKGTIIHIQFPEGHGLKPEDTVRYRGIEVGTVESVHLDDSLDGVEVEVLLKPSASQLAKEGTRFWIVRPELSLTRISGLETAIGHKYIGVSPNPNSEDASLRSEYKFQGLADVPVDTLSDSGIELILRGDKRYSVSKGSAVTFRGVDVGTVLDVALSQEARHVDVRVRIFDQHASLLTSQSKFWVSAGLDFDFKFGLNGGGFDLDTESLETLARGGVSMITTGQGTEVSPGDVFTLHAAADDDWYKSAANFQATDVALRGAVPFKASWSSRGLFGRKEKVAQFNGIAIIKDGVEQVVAPAQLLEKADVDESFKLSVSGTELDRTVFTSESDMGSTRTRSLKIEGSFDPFAMPEDGVSLEEPIDCLAVRRSSDQNISFHVAIRGDLIKPNTEQPELWDVIDFNGDPNVWHGSPVVTANDGKLIGMLLIYGRKTHILPMRFEEQNQGTGE
jgi:sporulation protein YlmC with PRC-barrel domain